MILEFCNNDKDVLRFESDSFGSIRKCFIFWFNEIMEYQYLLSKTDFMEFFSGGLEHLKEKVEMKHNGEVYIKPSTNLTTQDMFNLTQLFNNDEVFFELKITS
jgi:hypothetical protein